MQVFSFNWQPITLHSLEFKTIPFPAYTSLGTKYTRWVRVGMPKIPERTLNVAFYLYQSKEDARDGVGIGGTGFFLGVHSEKHPQHVYLYGVSNWHVVFEGGCSVIRVNTIDGRTDIIDYDPCEWDFIQGAGDMAISPILDLDSNKHLIYYVGADDFVTEKVISDLKLDVGDDVFMLGRFVDIDEGKTNLPAARFGHISVMPVYIPRERNNQNAKSYCIDLHSRTGYSGSPVFVYRTFFGDIGDIGSSKNPFDTSAFFAFLGMHWGQFPEIWKDKKGNEIFGLSGMSCVIPAERILDLINKPSLVTQRQNLDSEREEYYKKHGYPPIPDQTTSPKKLR